MASIVIELQREALNLATDVSDLLRKALVIASKLNIPEFQAWIENELSGYRDPKILLPYRRLVGQVMGQDEWGRWIPVLFEDEKMRELISQVLLFDSAAEVEALLQGALRNNGGNLSLEFSHEQNEILARNSVSGRMTRHTRWIRAEDLKGLIDALRTEILKWSLKLEKDGVLGEGMTFSKDEQQRAAGVHFTSHYYASVGNVAQNSQHIQQTANIGVRPQELAKFVAEFSEHLKELNLDDRQRRRAEAQLATLKAQLSDEPDSIIVQQAARTLRTITEGSIGSLIATALQPGVWDWIHRIMASF